MITKNVSYELVIGVSDMHWEGKAKAFPSIFIIGIKVPYYKSVIWPETQVN